MTPLEIVLLCLVAILAIALALSIRATTAWIRYVRLLQAEHHIRGPAPTDKF